ncbi:hypothetical protein Leryth_013073 [Lithospermum erythrorhizon]|nr:hypothetical protein Leryth_013073 [Lithospermum erythrorhizon]
MVVIQLIKPTELDFSGFCLNAFSMTVKPFLNHTLVGSCLEGELWTEKVLYVRKGESSIVTFVLSVFLKLVEAVLSKFYLGV